MAKIDQTEADELLDKMGDQIAELYDRTLESMTYYILSNENPKLAEEWQPFMEKQPDESTRQIKIVQDRLEHLLHDLLFYLQEQREFRIQARAKSGEWVNIDEYSDGIHGDLFDWLERKSKYGCVGNELLKISNPELF